MRRILVASVAMLLFSSLSLNTVSAQTAVYDPASGGITFEGVANIVGLRINSASDRLVPGQATNLDGATDGPFGVVNDQAPGFYEWGNLVGLNFASAFAGNVLPTDLSQAELDGDDVAVFLYRTSDEPTRDQRGAITGGTTDPVIPEPTSVLLAGLGLVGFMGTRRR